MVANAISQYLGVTKGELKELSSDGAITADIIKNAMFNAADDINGKFAQMPMTFADVWTKIKNTGMQAFGGVFEKANAMLNSDMGQAAIMNLTGLVYMVIPVLMPFEWDWVGCRPSGHSCTHRVGAGWGLVGVQRDGGDCLADHVEECCGYGIESDS